MKIFNKILFLVFVLVALSACEKNTGIDDTTSVDVEIPKHGYIFFNTERPTTRATLEQGKLLHNFSVIGYSYPAVNDWNTVKVQASQSSHGVFSQTGASQLVTYDGATHSYTPLKPWSVTSKYAFFAWYPTEIEDLNTGATKTVGTTTTPIEPKDYEGNPYITYTLPTGTDKAARGRMYDVMTACELDYEKAEGINVPLTMKHRLAALDVLAISMINPKSLNEAWKLTGDAAYKDNDVITVKVTEMSLKLESIKTSVKIPLNTNETSEQLVASGSATPTYTGFTLGTIPYYTGADNNLIELVGANEKLILIPQTEAISATISLSYQILCNGTPIEKDGKTTFTDSETITINGLKEGVYHYMLVTFTKSGILLQAHADESWEEYRVEHEFN